MNAVLMSLMIVLCITLLVVLLLMIIFWACSTNNTRIKFKSFIKFYEINPNRWHLGDDYVSCNVTGNSYGYALEPFSFGLIDYYRYKLWLKSKERAERQQAHAESTSRMLAAVQQDVDKQNEAAKRKQDEAINIIIELMKNTHASVGGNDRLDKILEEVKNL